MHNISSLEQYETCWFEIRTNDKSMLIRNREKFLKKSEIISRLEEVRLYRIEKSDSGMKKSRLHAI